MATSTPSTYCDVLTNSGKRVTLTFTPDGDGSVWVYTATAALGGYSLDRFGPDPLTDAGRVKRSAIANLFTLA